jgi:hypothetical protein
MNCIPAASSPLRWLAASRILSFHRPAAYDLPQLTPSDFDQLLSQSIDWIYFERPLQMSPVARQLTIKLLDGIPGARRFYDVNLRVVSYAPSLVWELMMKATVVKLNDTEVAQISEMIPRPYHSLEEFCRRYARVLVVFRFIGGLVSAALRYSGRCISPRLHLRRCEAAWWDYFNSMLYSVFFWPTFQTT